jgi:hypothetical protein
MAETEIWRQETMTKEIKPTEARQGRRGWQVLVILIVGLLLAPSSGGASVSTAEPSSRRQDQVGGDPIEQPAEETPHQPEPEGWTCASY